MNDYIAFNTMPTTVKSVSVSDNVCNQESLKEWTLEFWSNLESLQIGSYCFKYCKLLTLKSLFKLKTFVVGKLCFTERTFEEFDAEKIGVSDGGLVIENCTLLNSIDIGPMSFADASVFQLKSSGSERLRR